MDTGVIYKNGDSPDWRSTLETFYEQHNPSKVGGVGVLLKQFAGQERDLWDVLLEKYVLKTPTPGSQPPSLENSHTPRRSVTPQRTCEDANPTTTTTTTTLKTVKTGPTSRLLAPTASFSMKAAGEGHSDLTIIRIDCSKVLNKTLGIICDGLLIEEVLPHSAADKSGIVPGMTLVSLNGKGFPSDNVSINRILRNSPTSFSLTVRLPEGPSQSRKVVYSSNPIHVLCSKSHSNQRLSKTASTTGVQRDTAVTSGRRGKRDTTWADRDFWPPAKPKWVSTKKEQKQNPHEQQPPNDSSPTSVEDRATVSALDAMDENNLSEEALSPPPSTSPSVGGIAIAVDIQNGNKSPSGSRPGSRANSPVAKFGYSASPKPDPPTSVEADKSLPKQPSAPPSASPERDSSPVIINRELADEFEHNEQLAEVAELQRDISVELPPPTVRTAERIALTDAPPAPRVHSPVPTQQSSLSREREEIEETNAKRSPSPVPIPTTEQRPSRIPQQKEKKPRQSRVSSATRRKQLLPAEMRTRRQSEPTSPLSEHSSQVSRWNSVMTAGIRGPLTQVEKFELALQRKGNQKKQAFDHFRKIKNEEEKLTAIEQRITRNDDEREKRLQAKMREFEELKKRQEHVHAQRVHSSRISSRRPTI